MRQVPVGIRIPQPEQVLESEVEFVDNLIYDSHKPEQAFAVSSPDVGDAYTETFPNAPNTPNNLQVSMTGEDASLTWTKSEK